MTTPQPGMSREGAVRRAHLIFPWDWIVELRGGRSARRKIADALQAAFEEGYEKGRKDGAS